MGVKNLWGVLDRSALTDVCLSTLQGQTVAIDVSGWLFQAQGSGQVGKIHKPHLRTLFFRVSKLMQCGITPVCVFEGWSPEMKSDTIQYRRNQSSDGLNIREKGTSGKFSIQRQAGEKRLLSWREIECCRLLDLLGVPYLQSYEEAETMCAVLNASRYVDGCMTEDGDAFLFGANTVYRNLDMKKGTVDQYTMKCIQRDSGLKREGLVAIAMLVGCDYGMTGIRRVGIKTAVELVTQLGGDGRALKRFMEWRNCECFVELKKYKNEAKPTHCTLCQHPGNKTKHVNHGCSVCCMASGCVQQHDGKCPCEWHAHQRELERHKTEMNVWEQAVQYPGFPDQKIIDAFLHPKEKCPQEKFQLERPNMEKLEKFCMTEMGWTEEQNAKRIIPVITSWQLLFSPSTEPILHPTQIVKARQQNKQQVFDVTWRKTGQPEGKVYESVENRDLMRKAHPELVANFELKSCNDKTTPGKRTPKFKTPRSGKEHESLSYSIEKYVKRSKAKSNVTRVQGSDSIEVIGDTDMTHHTNQYTPAEKSSFSLDERDRCKRKLKFETGTDFTAQSASKSQNAVCGGSESTSQNAVCGGSETTSENAVSDGRDSSDDDILPDLDIPITPSNQSASLKCHGNDGKTDHEHISMKLGHNQNDVEEGEGENMTRKWIFMDQVHVSPSNRKRKIVSETPKKKLQKSESDSKLLKQKRVTDMFKTKKK